MQRVWRGARARRALAQLRDKVMASVALQRLWRGAVTRKHLPEVIDKIETEKFSVTTETNVSQVRRPRACTLHVVVYETRPVVTQRYLLCALAQVFDLIDTSGDGEISLPEFLKFCRGRKVERCVTSACSPRVSLP